MSVRKSSAIRSIPLQKLCRGIIPDIANIAVEVSGLSIDSRRCQPGDLFLAYPGSLADGRDYIAQAIEKGAAAVIFEQADDIGSVLEFLPSPTPGGLNIPTPRGLTAGPSDPQKDAGSRSQAAGSWRDDGQFGQSRQEIEQEPESQGGAPDCYVPMIAAHNLQSLIGLLAYRFHDNSIADMRITGITGTNGKTSIAYLIAQASGLLGHDCAYIGTLGVGCPPEIQPTALTTEDAIENHAKLATFHRQGIHRCAMEVSSHALDQGRVNGIPYKTAIFTNLSHDHLDYHQTMQSYGEAKARLLTTEGLETAIINIDDPWARSLLSSLPRGVQAFTYSLENKEASLYASQIQYSVDGIKATLMTPWGEGQLRSLLLGHFNLSNLLAAIAALALEGHGLEKILELVASLNGIPGRMECLRQDNAPLAIVDYAHTPDALEQALKSIKNIPHGALYCVFGCGGDRDRDKRSAMGQVAATWADKPVLTNDNPRHEMPEAIIDDIRQGIGDEIDFEVIMDRKAAIEHCLRQATSNDVILVAGKGHEDYQIVGDERLDFSDQAVIKDFWAC